jgi:serine/threonine-protein kinase
VLAGKYRVERVLGAGGMGVVVAALHLELDERVAVKFLLPELSENTSAAARFMREARAAARIKSEYAARVIDVGRLETGAPYMVMEYLEGRDLAGLVASGPLSIDDAVDYVIQACHAMAEAHAAGIVHRDLKPANLFLAQRPDGTRVIKVLDFGISKSAAGDLADAGLTKTSTMMGSPYYMSPEQMRSARDVDHRTDIWSLGVILFELLAGRAPFQGDSLPELLTSIMTDTTPSLVALRPEVPPTLEQVVYRCLQKSRDTRMHDVGELTRALLPFGTRRSRDTAERVLKLTGSLESLPASLAPAAAPVELGATVAIGGQTATNWADTRGHAAQKNTRRRLVWAFSALALTLVGFSVAHFSRSKPSAVATAASQPSSPELASDTTKAPASASAQPVSSRSEAPSPALAPLVEPVSSASVAPTVAPVARVNAQLTPKRQLPKASAAKAKTRRAAINRPPCRCRGFRPRSPGTAGSLA